MASPPDAEILPEFIQRYSADEDEDSEPLLGEWLMITLSLNTMIPEGMKTQSLPNDDHLRAILSYLTPSDVGKCALLSERMCGLCFENGLWKILYKRSYNIPEIYDKRTYWYQEYKETVCPRLRRDTSEK